MIISNLMTLANRSKEIYKWFMEMFIDSSEWVMTPNVFGMGTFADGGILLPSRIPADQTIFLK